MLQNGKILENKQVAKNVYEMVIEAPDIAKAAKPGQFVNLRLSEKLDPLLRRPISLHGIDAEAGTFTMLYLIVGEGTTMMSRMEVGDMIDVLGPLGNGWNCEFEGEYGVLVGGGIGVAPLYPLAKSLVEQGKALGIYAWQLCVSGDPDVILPLIEANKDCAFTILCDPETVTEASRFSMYIDAQSIAYPCSFGLGKSEYCVDLKSSSLKDAWNSKQFARFREKQEHMCQGCNVHGCRSCALNLGLNLCGKL